MRGESGACLQNDAKALVTSVHTGNTPSHTRTQDNGTDRHLGRVEHELTRMLAKRRILAAGLFCHMAGFREGFLGALQPQTQALRRSVANKACCSLWRATAHSASNSFHSSQCEQLSSRSAMRQSWRGSRDARVHARFQQRQCRDKERRGRPLCPLWPRGLAQDCRRRSPCGDVLRGAPAASRHLKPSGYPPHTLENATP